MNGPLSKWTNVMQGWQYRWFVLEEENGLLTYYTGKDKFLRGQRRGCVRLKGAVLGIDDEDDCTFTITVDGKMFHFQAHTAAEREKWVRGLETQIQKHSGYYRTRGRKFIAATQTKIEDFDRKIQEADKYLQIMIDNVKTIEERSANIKDQSERTTVNNMLAAANSLLETVKHSIVLLQIAKGHAFPATGVFSPSLASHNALGTDTLSIRHPHHNTSVSDAEETDSSNTRWYDNDLTPQGRKKSNSLSTASLGAFAVETSTSARDGGSSSCVHDQHFVSGKSLLVPPISYSSSEDEDYFDTVEFYDMPVDDDGSEMMVDDRLRAQAGNGSQSNIAIRSADEPDFGDNHVDFDAVYEDDDEDDLVNVQEHGSVIMHLLSQVSVGMDLTKIVLPTFILERRSLLEMYGDFFSHPDIFLKITDMPTPQERMVSCLRWFLSAFHAGRKSGVAKKPYNPILGETFSCHYDVPGYEYMPVKKVEDGPIPGIKTNQLVFTAEQVSHHPPISAFYGECVDKRVQFDAHIWTRSKFLGLSIGVHMVGQGCISLLDHNEEYIVTFPNGYGRSILTTPWIELGGKCTITCAKTGYNSEIEFLTKPFYGGKTNQIRADAYQTGQKAPFLTVKGAWNAVMMAKWANKSEEEAFLDVHKLTIIKKRVKPIAEQDDYESRRMWRHVTYALKEKDVNTATKGKHWLEQRQRTEAKERAERNIKWNTKNFQESGDHWVYRWPLRSRAQQRR